MKLYKLKFNTANVTIDDLRSDYDFSPPSDEELKEYLKAFQALDKTEFMGYQFSHMEKEGVYGMGGTRKEDEEKVMNWIYQIEQDAMFGSYKNDYEQFVADWKAERYEPAASWHIPEKYLEVVEFVKEVTD